MYTYICIYLYIYEFRVHLYNMMDIAAFCDIPAVYEACHVSNI